MLELLGRHVSHRIDRQLGHMSRETMAFQQVAISEIFQGFDDGAVGVVPLRVEFEPLPSVALRCFGVEPELVADGDLTQVAVLTRLARAHVLVDTHFRFSLSLGLRVTYTTYATSGCLRYA